MPLSSHCLFLSPIFIIAVMSTLNRFWIKQVLVKIQGTNNRLLLKLMEMLFECLIHERNQTILRNKTPSCRWRIICSSTGFGKGSPLMVNLRFPFNVNQQQIKLQQSSTFNNSLVPLNCWETVDVPCNSKLKVSSKRADSREQEVMPIFIAHITNNKSSITSRFFHYAHEVACMPFYPERRPNNVKIPSNVIIQRWCPLDTVWDIRELKN